MKIAGRYQIPLKQFHKYIIKTSEGNLEINNITQYVLSNTT